MKAGWNTLAGVDSAKLTEAIDHFLPWVGQPEIFGEYSCGEKMVWILAEGLSKKQEVKSEKEKVGEEQEIRNKK